MILRQALDEERRAECARAIADACTPCDTETQRMEPVPGTALQWVRFPGIAWRTDETPRRRRADPPRPSRFGDLKP